MADAVEVGNGCEPRAEAPDSSRTATRVVGSCAAGARCPCCSRDIVARCKDHSWKSAVPSARARTSARNSFIVKSTGPAGNEEIAGPKASVVGPRDQGGGTSLAKQEIALAAAATAPQADPVIEDR